MQFSLVINVYPYLLRPQFCKRAIDIQRGYPFICMLYDLHIFLESTFRGAQQFVSVEHLFGIQ